MTEKFTLEDLFLKIIPGGILIGVIYFVFKNDLKIEIISGLDFFYTFLFFTFSFLTGEILQTVSHEIEWVIFSFYKFYKPSEVFLYKNNPVLKNEYLRVNIIESLGLTQDEKDCFEQDYKSLSLFWWKRKNQQLSQSIFWRLYSTVSSDIEIKIFNRNYLFVRAILVVFLIFITISIVKINLTLMTFNIILFLIFLWRARGMARTLVFKTVMINLKSKKNETNCI